MIPSLPSSQIATIKKNLRLFNGFPFGGDSEEYTRKRDKLLKSVWSCSLDEEDGDDEFNRLSQCRNANFTNSKLKVVCSVLDLEKKGTHSDLIERIMNFLVAPKNSGKVRSQTLLP